MYNQEIFITIDEIVVWLNKHKTVDVRSIIYTGENYALVYYEEEPQPQQKDLIPESDKKESL